MSGSIAIAPTIMLLDTPATLIAIARKCGRANGKEIMARPRYQDGSLFIRGKRTKVWAARWREDVIDQEGTLHRTQRTVVLGTLNELSRREARLLLQQRISEINQGRHRVRPVMTLERFARECWTAGALLALKPSSARYYSFQLDRHVFPKLGSTRLCDLSRPVIQRFLLDRKHEGFSSSTVHGIHTTLAKVLQTAVEQGYLETNPARAIRIGERTAKRERKLISVKDSRTLLSNLPSPCNTIVAVAVLTGLRIGEILALRWKRLDFSRRTVAVAETFSDGSFGTPKTKSSSRVVPMSMWLHDVLQEHRQTCKQIAPDDLVFSTSRGTPLSSKNLYNRILAPTCDRLALARVSWHAFRHMNATLLGELGESVKTAQALLGHSDLQTTLNTYMHVVPESQRRAVERVAGVLFPDVPKSDPASLDAAAVN